MNAPRSRVGSRFGPYELRSLLGEGSAGAVYEAFDTERGQLVAVKLLSEDWLADPQRLQRFRQESQAAAQLTHRNIVPINNWGEVVGVPYVDMKLIRGDDLRTVLRKEAPLDPVYAFGIINQVAAALDAAHAAGLVHGAVKPTNIVIGAGEKAYLTDFGTVGADGDPTARGGSIAAYTYLAPECFDASTLTSRCDTYALACVLHECLTGTVPFESKSISDLIHSHMSRQPPRASLSRRDVPEAMDAVIACAMEKDPENRYGSAGEFAGAARVALGLSERVVQRSEPATNTSSGGFPVVAPTGRQTRTAAKQPGPEGPRTNTSYLPSSWGRAAVESGTFQPFGPSGPTIKSQFRPRPPRERSGTTGEMPRVAQRGTAKSAGRKRPEPPADPTPSTPPKPAQPGPQPGTAPSLRIIAPADRNPDTGGDLPVIHPADPTVVRPSESQFTALPTDKSAPSKPGAKPPTPPRPGPPPPAPTRPNAGPAAPTTPSTRIHRPTPNTPPVPAPPTAPTAPSSRLNRPTPNTPPAPANPPTAPTAPSTRLNRPAPNAPSAPQRPPAAATPAGPSTRVNRPAPTPTPPPPVTQPGAGSARSTASSRVNPPGQARPAPPAPSARISRPELPSSPVYGGYLRTIGPGTTRRGRPPTPGKNTPDAQAAAPQLPFPPAPMVPPDPSGEGNQAPDAAPPPSTPQQRYPAPDSGPQPEIPAQRPAFDPASDKYAAPAQDKEYPSGEYASGEYASGEYPGGQYASDKYPSAEYASGEYTSDKYPSSEYAGDKYPSDKYTDGQYSSDKYPSAEYASGEYARGEYPNGKYPSGEYASDKYPSAEYASDNYPSSEYASGEYASGNYPSGEYGSKAPSAEFSRGNGPSAEYAYSTYEQNNYRKNQYGGDTDYGRDQYGRDNFDEYDYGNDPYSEDGLLASEGYDDDSYYEAPRKRGFTSPAVLIGLGLAAAALVGVVAWHFLTVSDIKRTNREESALNGVTMSATPSPEVASPSPSPSASSPSASTPPAGATTCPAGQGWDGKFTRSATGSSVTSCGFAEAVRESYVKAMSGGQSGANIVAVSPVTGRSYTMSCTTGSALITCTGGENAVVYVY